MKILVTGSLAYDRIMDFPGRFKEHILPDKIHILNVSFTLNRFEEQFGGTAGNIAYNLKLLGLEPVILGAAGSDFGRYQEYLKKKGISVERIAIDDNEYTAVGHIITDLDDNQITAFYPGAYQRSVSLDIPKEFRSQDSLLIVAPSSKQEIAKRCQEAKASQLPYIFDPGQQIIALSPEEAVFGATNSKVSIFNDYEWQVFSEKSGLALSDLTGKGIVVIVTRGQEGSIIYTAGREYQISVAKPERVEDPTGAGDAYRSGIVAGIINNWDWQIAGQVAATIASFAVEHYGTQRHEPSLEQVRERYQKSFQNNCPL